MFLYLLVEGDNVIGDGLYVYHRGKHAVDELKTKVDEYYPKVQAIDSVMVRALSDEDVMQQDTIQSCRETEIPGAIRKTIIRRRLFPDNSSTTYSIPF